MNKSVSPELVNEIVRFSAHALRQKAAEIEATQGARSPAAALAAVGQALAADSLIELPELCQRLGAGQPLWPGSVAEALAGFGQEADQLRALLASLEAVAAE